MGLFENIFKWKRRDDEPEYEIEDWNEIVYDRDDLQINDKKQRKEYVPGADRRSLQGTGRAGI